MYWFTADEHYDHANIIKFCDRPFSNVQEMNKVLIANHNSVVGKGDTIIHIGDFTLRNTAYAVEVIKQLIGAHIFVKGSHDYWLKTFKGGEYRTREMIYELTYEKKYIVCCHYPMRSWPRSFHGSWLLHGHEHGRYSTVKNSIDIGVDCQNFYPISFDQIKERISE